MSKFKDYLQKYAPKMYKDLFPSDTERYKVKFQLSLIDGATKFENWMKEYEKTMGDYQEDLKGYHNRQVA